MCGKNRGGGESSKLYKKEYELGTYKWVKLWYVCVCLYVFGDDDDNWREHNDDK